jgi:hypothetical protein
MREFGNKHICETTPTPFVREFPKNNFATITKEDHKDRIFYQFNQS